MKAYVHPTAHVEDGATIADGCWIWHDAQIRRGATIGLGVRVGKGVFVDVDVIVGAGSKIQNYACLYQGVTLGRRVFVGPHACFTNDREPRAAGPWELARTQVDDGASIGANATIVAGVIIGRNAMIGAGTVVTHDVVAYGKIVGNPGRLVGFVCACAGPLVASPSTFGAGYCPTCQIMIEDLPWSLLH